MVRWNQDRGLGTNDAGYALRECGWLFRHRRLHLSEVFVIVHANREHYRRILDRGKQPHALQWNPVPVGRTCAIQRAGFKDAVQIRSETDQVDDVALLEPAWPDLTLDFDRDELHGPYG